MYIYATKFVEHRIGRFFRERGYLLHSRKRRILPKDGCPFCRMRDMLEDRMATYITGAAMMEPDVRVETNRLGFCAEHFNQILARGSRLSVALILESLLAHRSRRGVPRGEGARQEGGCGGPRRQEHCFVCENIEKNMPTWWTAP